MVDSSREWSVRVQRSTFISVHRYVIVVFIVLDNASA